MFKSVTLVHIDILHVLESDPIFVYPSYHPGQQHSTPF